MGSRVSFDFVQQCTYIALFLVQEPLGVQMFYKAKQREKALPALTCRYAHTDTFIQYQFLFPKEVG